MVIAYLDHNMWSSVSFDYHSFSNSLVLQDTAQHKYLKYLSSMVLLTKASIGVSPEILVMMVLSILKRYITNILLCIICSNCIKCECNNDGVTVDHDGAIQ